MKLKVYRKAQEDTYTIGNMYIDSLFFCNTLEDKVRIPFIKIPHETAIPEGTYKFTLEYSPKHKRIVPLLQSVPHFEAIEIHPGNTDEDTWGCLLVGENLEKGKVLNSKATFEKLMKILEDSKQTEWEIEIINKI